MSVPAAMTSTQLHAWVDEAMRVDIEADRGTYILAAALGDPRACEPVRDRLRALLVGRASRLHWHDENRAQRHKIAQAVAAAGLPCIVVVGVPIARKKQERARRICLEALLPELDRAGVGRVHMEARTPSLMAADRRHLSAMVGRHLIGSDIRVENTRPLDEPMLRLPDAVCGAVGAARNGQPQWWDLIQHTVTVLDIPLR